MYNSKHLDLGRFWFAVHKYNKRKKKWFQYNFKVNVMKSENIPCKQTSINERKKESKSMKENLFYYNINSNVDRPRTTNTKPVLCCNH